MRTTEALGHPCFEHLSAAAFQRGSMPDLDDAIRLGHSERLEIAADDSGKELSQRMFAKWSHRRPFQFRWE
jgi:hypothetical protein